MSLLIIGATGTLGRQIVLIALTKGYKVRCLVRNFSRASFLKDWGAELIYGDLTVPETIPPCLLGINAIIDASTTRPDDFNTLKNVDWYGKLALIEAAEIANIERFIFCSIPNVEKNSKIPLIKMKYGIEKRLQQSTMHYTIFQLTGFYQGLIEQYAIPILENLPIWVTSENIGIPYMDAQDLAKFFLKSLQIPSTKNCTFLLEGPKSWISQDIISLCEEFSAQSANVKKIPVFFLKSFSQILSFFAWSQNISNRLAFVDILARENKFPIAYKDVYTTFKIDYLDINRLDDYFIEYFVRLFEQLRDINFEDIQKQRNLIL